VLFWRITAWTGAQLDVRCGYGKPTATPGCARPRYRRRDLVVLRKWPVEWTCVSIPVL